MTLSAAITHHWALDETTLPTVVSGAWGVVADTGTTPATDGRMFGYAVTSPLPAGVVGNAGPTGFGTSYNFIELAGSNAVAGVFTNSNNAIPTVGDFSLFLQVATTDQQAAQGHLFSNNNGQAKRSNLYLSAGSLGFFLSGGAFDTDNNGTSNGDAFSVAVNSTIPGGINIFDGAYHQIGLAREGTRFDLTVDGAVIYSATTTTTGAFDDISTSWMIGRARSNNNDFDGSIADVQVHDVYMVPEPSSLSLLGLSVMLLARRRRC